MMSAACPQCQGTDVQDHCAQGQCYFQEMQRQQEEHDRQREAEYQRDMERQAMEEHFERHPHG